MRRASKVDSNHAEIVQALRQVGAEVLDLSRVGGGCPDLLVQFRGAVMLLEVKARRGRLTAFQLQFNRHWRVSIVRNVDEALAALQAVPLGVGEAMRAIEG